MTSISASMSAAVKRRRKSPAVVGPLVLAEAVLDAALAIAEPLLYTSFHLKYLHAGMVGKRSDTPIDPEMPRYFKFFSDFSPSRRGGNACLGSSGSTSSEAAP